MSLKIIYISLKKFSFGDLLEMQAEIVDETDVYIDVHKRYCIDIYLLLSHLAIFLPKIH